MTPRNNGLLAFVTVTLLLMSAGIMATTPPSGARTPSAGSMRRLTGGTRQLTTDTGPQFSPAISGNLVVFTDQRNGNDDIYYIDLATEAEVQVTNSPASQRLNDVAGNLIVYTDQTNGNKKVMVYDVNSHLTQQAGNGLIDSNPKVDNGLVVFERGTGINTDVYGWDGTNAFSIAAEPNVAEVNPAVSGTRVVYERHQYVNGVQQFGDMVVVDTATQEEIVLEEGPAISRRPDIDGNIVTWDEVDPRANEPDQNIVWVDLADPSLTRHVIDLPEGQLRPHVSGHRIAFDDQLSGDPDVKLYDIDTDAVTFVASYCDLEFCASEFLNNIDGNRIVYTSDQAGNSDIWLFEIGDTGAVEICNGVDDDGDGSVDEGFPDLDGDGMADCVDPDDDDDGVLDGADNCPIIANANQADSDHDGVGDACDSTPNGDPPSQQIADMLAFFDAAVGQGTLTGKNADVKALRRQLEEAKGFIQKGKTRDACHKLEEALDGTDGDPRPKDKVTGPAAAELARRIRLLRAALGCS